MPMQNTSICARWCSKAEPNGYGLGRSSGSTEAHAAALCEKTGGGLTLFRGTTWTPSTSPGG